MAAAGVHAFLEFLWRPAPGVAGIVAGLLRALLLPFSFLYGLAAAVRGLLYDSGMLATVEVGVPVISVGSISVGGAGKTPLVIWLVQWCRHSGRQPVVVSRGYRGPTVEPSVVDLDSRQGADEALMVAARTGCPVVTGRDRVLACRLAIERFAPDLIIVDDGFQHRRLARQLDLVIAPADEEYALLPAGPLREPRRALGRADLVVRTRSEAAGLVTTTGARDVEDARVLLDGRRVLAVAGIARPRPFLATLRGLGAGEVTELLFADHHAYTPVDIARIRRAAAGYDLVVTTEKDLVKLGGANLGAARLFALRIISIPDKREEIETLVGGLDRKRSG